MRQIALIALALATTSCASSDPYSFSYREINDPTRVLSKPPVAGARASVVIRREPALGGSANTHYGLLDGTKVVRLYQGEQVTLDVAAGQHMVGATCEGAFSDITNELLFVAEADRAYHFRVFTSSNGPCAIAPMREK